MLKIEIPLYQKQASSAFRFVDDTKNNLILRKAEATSAEVRHVMRNDNK